MNRKWMIATVAGIAVLALAYGGTTYSAWSDFGDVKDNSVGAGFLRLNLDGRTGSTPAAPITWDRLTPGSASLRTVWLASKDGQSVPDGTLSATFSNLVDHENGCSTGSEWVADPTCDGSIESSGDLSHVLTFRSSYYPEATQGECARFPATPPAVSRGHDAFFAHQQNNLVNPAPGEGQTYVLRTPDSREPLVLSPGEGICVGFGVFWPPEPRPRAVAPYDNDNVAQGDSFTFDVRFTLTQK